VHRRAENPDYPVRPRRASVQWGADRGPALDAILTRCGQPRGRAPDRSAGLSARRRPRKWATWCTGVSRGSA